MINEMCTSDHISRYFHKYGWKFVNKDGIWTSGWQGQQFFFPLQVALNETFVLVDVTPVYTINQLIKIRPFDFWDLINELNARLQIFKLTIADEKDITLCGQFFRYGFDFKLFDQCLGILGYYCDQIYEEFDIRLNENLFYLQ